MINERIRLVSGLILTAFLLCHLLNHAFGLISIAAMNEAHRYLLEIWRTPPGTMLLIAATIGHIAVAAIAIMKKRTLRMPAWEWAQIISGFAIPLLLVTHIIGTRIGEEFYAIKPDYRSVLSILWVISPKDGIMQTLALLVAWTHACVGLHFWLRTKPFHGRWRRLLILGAITVPTLSISGYIAAGFELLEESNRDHMLAEILSDANISQASTAPLFELLPWSYGGVTALLLLPFAVRFIHRARISRRGHRIVLPNGRPLRGIMGATILETLRENGIGHAAVCGGRGRCTTCRIRIVKGATTLPDPNDTEQRALERIKALPGVRLACQVRPINDLTISPLLPATANARDGRRPGGLQGEERVVACLFIDIRGSTKMGELKLPYDVLFILNQFFAEMNQAVEETGGHYAQFNGDGMMALYGIRGEPPERAARRALQGAASMQRRIDKLNETLSSELPFPLRAGIGLHLGEAIVGAMGPPVAQITSAIGDTINTTARLESMTKQHEALLVVSEALAKAAKLTLDENIKHETIPRGRADKIAYYAIQDMSLIEGT